MLKKKKNLLSGVLFLFLLALCSNAFAYEIVENSVVWENNLAQLKVTPHTAESPVNNFTQVFDLNYFGGVAAEDVRVVYYFPEPITGGIEKYNFETSTWVNITNKFHYLGNVEVDGNSVYYYYSDEFNLNPEHNLRWRLNYRPDTNSGKWNLAFIQGDIDCLVTDTCIRQWVLDPWWYSGAFSSRFSIYNLVIPVDYNISNRLELRDINFSALDSMCNDLNDLRVVDTNLNVDLNRTFDGNIQTQDGNIRFKLDAALSAGTYNGRFQLYSNNSNCPAPLINISQTLFVDTFEDGDRTSDTAWTAGTVHGDYAKVGSYGLGHTGAGHTEATIETESIEETVWGGWYRTTDATSQIYLYLWDAGQASIMGVNIETDTMYYVSAAGETKTAFSTTPLDNTWYFIEMYHAKNAATGKYKLYSADSVLLETKEVSGLDTSAVDVIDLYVAAGPTVSLDNIVYGFEEILTPSFSIAGLEHYPDVTAPNMNYFDVNFSIGFNPAVGALIALRCDDDSNGLINYSIVANDVNLLNSNQDNNTFKSVSFSPNGINNVSVICTDSNGNQSSDMNIFLLYQKHFNLIDEENGGVFDVSTVEQITVRSFDYNFVYDLKSAGATDFNYFTNTNDTLRFDINYNNATMISREFSTASLVGITDVNVCVAPQQQLFEVIIISATKKNVDLINNNFKCRSLTTNTKYAYGESVSISAYTISAPYYMYLVDGNTRTLLSLIDGSRADVISVDVIEFNLRTYSLELTREGISSVRIDANTTLIRFLNLDNDSISSEMQIYDLNGAVLFTYSETIHPNDFNVLFNHTTIPVSDANLLKVTVTKTLSDGSTSTLTYYFTIAGKEAPTSNPVLHAIIALLLIIFGMTLVNTRIAFGWFGIIIMLAAMAFLSLATQVWFIIFLEGLTLIGLLWVIIIYWSENPGVT